MFKITKNFGIPKVYVLYFMFAVIIALLLILYRQHGELSKTDRTTTNNKVKFIIKRDSILAAYNLKGVDSIRETYKIKSDVLKIADSLTKHIDSIGVSEPDVSSIVMQEPIKRHSDSFYILSNQVDSLKRVLSFFKNRYPHFNIISDTTTRYDIDLQIIKRYEPKKILGLKIGKKKFYDIRTNDPRTSIMGDSIYTIRIH